MTVAPCLFLLLAELLLWALGFGVPTQFFVRIRGRDMLTTNERYGWRFFGKELARSPIACEMPPHKPQGTRRIFVLGESAAQGFPEPAFGFARFLQVMLEETYPAQRFEVINTAVTAINSHVTRSILRDCLRQEADAVVILLGNNEVVGPYGAGTVFAGYAPNLTLIRIGMAARATRCGQLLSSLAARARGENRRSVQWRGMEMFAHSQVAADDPRMRGVYAHFVENLRAMCTAARRAGAEILLCTVPTNLRDCAPFGSAHKADMAAADLDRWETAYRRGIERQEQRDYEGAVAAYLEAWQLDPRFADLAFRLGLCHAARGDFAKARDCLTNARDLDTQRFRADTPINATIRQLAAESPSGAVHLVDAEEDFAAADASAPGLAGSNLFLEHVHMNPQGNYLLASSVFRALRESIPAAQERAAPAGSAEPPSFEQCCRLLGLTEWSRYSMLKTVVEMMARPSFSQRIGQAAEIEKLRNAVDQQCANALSPKALADAEAAVREALARRPQDLFLHANLAELLARRGNLMGAEGEWNYLLQRLPDNAAWRSSRADCLSGMGRIDEAMAEYEKARPFLPESVIGLNMGYALASNGKLEQSLPYFRALVAMEPGPVEAYGNLGLALDKLGKRDEALSILRKAAQVDPGSEWARLNIGVVLEGQMKLDDAAEQYREALAINPHLSEAWNNLGQIRLRQSRLADADEAFRKALGLNPYLAESRSGLGMSLAQQADRAGAEKQFRTLLQIRPNDAEALQTLAVLLATDPACDAAGAAEAIALAERLCRLDGNQTPACLDSLALAYAAGGRFDKALATGRKAEERARLLKQDRQAMEIRQHMMLFEAGRPFHRGLKP